MGSQGLDGGRLVCTSHELHGNSGDAAVCLGVIMNLIMCERCVSQARPSVCVFMSGLCLPSLSFRARRAELFSPALAHFSMKIRFLLLPLLLLCLLSTHTLLAFVFVCV